MGPIWTLKRSVKEAQARSGSIFHYSTVKLGETVSGGEGRKGWMKEQAKAFGSCTWRPGFILLYSSGSELLKR